VNSIRRIERMNYGFGAILVAASALTQPQDIALGIAIGVLLTCINFFVLRKLVTKWTREAATGRGGNASLLMLPKMLGLMGAVALAVLVLPIDVVAFRFPHVNSPDVLQEMSEHVRKHPAGGLREAWSYLDTRDAAYAVELGLTAPLSGAHTFFVTASTMSMSIRERFRELVHPDRIAVHEEIPAAGFAALGEVHQRAGTVVDMNGRHPRPGLPELQHTAAGHDRLDDALAKPRGVAVHPPGKRGDDWQPGGDISVEAIECGRQAASPGGRLRRFVLGDRTGAGFTACGSGGRPRAVRRS